MHKDFILKRDLYFLNGNNFSVNNYFPFSSPTTALPSRTGGFAQLNDSACPNVPVIFSTDGINVYKGLDNSIIFTGLLADASSTNAATVVPISGDRALIITTSRWNHIGGNPAYSSIIGFTGSCGSYTYSMPAATKNLSLPASATGVTNICEKVTVIKKASGNDYWLIMHEATNAAGGSTKFLVFSINYVTGVITAFADTNIGLPIRRQGGVGQMQAVYSQSVFSSGPGYYLAAAYFQIAGSFFGGVDLLAINHSTGAISFIESATSTWARPYGLEFARNPNPSTAYLYISPRNATKSIFRFNASLTPGTIFSSGTASTYGGTIPNRRFGQLQCLDNDAIYAPMYNSTTLLSIPSSSLTASFPTVTAPTLTGGSNFSWGLSNYWRN